MFALTIAVLSVLPAIVVGNLASLIVPDEMLAALIAATLNVPKPTIYNISPVAAPDAKTTEDPLDAV